jgi:two-component system sensor histidine kinase KdpD
MSPPRGPHDARTVFDDERRRLLSTFAAGAALAIERATLAEAALRAAVLARSDELKSALLSSVSHDLRTPLAAIKGSVSSLLVEGTGVTWDDATRREFLLTIDEETDRLTRLVGNLLDLSRIEAGALHPHREPYPLDELLWQAIDRLAVPGLAERVRVTLPDDLPLVPLDPVLLERVFTNLLENAAKYAPPDTPIDVVAERQGREVRVSVIDRGPGVPADERARIFDRFYRAGQSRVVKGTGLGLAISRGFVEAHGGRLWVEDAPGGGACFVVALPLDRAMSDEQ